jgi:hypothetical protein
MRLSSLNAKEAIGDQSTDDVGTGDECHGVRRRLFFTDGADATTDRASRFVCCD